MNELKDVSIFQKLSPEELQSLSKIAVPRTYASETTVFSQDDASDALYVISAGSVKVYRSTTDGRERILQVLGPRDILGEIALLDGYPRSATAQTLEETRMLVILRKAFETHVLASPQILWKVQHVICQKLRALSNEVVDISFRDVRHRLLSLLLHLATRHGTPREGGVEIGVRLMQRDLADMVGSNRETVTRLMTRFSKEGLLTSRRGRICLIDVERILGEVGGLA